MTLLTWIALLMGGAAIFGDLRSRRIPNCLTVSGGVAGLALGSRTGGLQGLGIAAAGAAVGFVVYLLFHLLGGMGGGDLKLMAAFGTLLGPMGILTAALLAAVLGGIVAGAALLWKPRTVAIPYAPAIVTAAWICLWAR